MSQQRERVAPEHEAMPRLLNSDLCTGNGLSIAVDHTNYPVDLAIFFYALVSAASSSDSVDAVCADAEAMGVAKKKHRQIRDFMGETLFNPAPEASMRMAWFNSISSTAVNGDRSYGVFGEELRNIC